jgi:hypothetical protein
MYVHHMEMGQSLVSLHKFKLMWSSLERHFWHDLRIHLLFPSKLSHADNNTGISCVYVDLLELR